MTAANYMQLSPMVRSFVPYLVIIDRTGMIREQYTGSDPFLSDESAMEKNIRTEVLKLLSENGKTALKHSKRVAKK